MEGSGDSTVLCGGRRQRGGGKEGRSAGLQEVVVSRARRAATPAQGEDEGIEDGEEAAVLSPRTAGIRSDLAEIGGRMWSGFSMLQNNLAVAEISKIASSLLPFGQGEADEGESVPGITEEVVVFVRHISTRPETWLDFPLFISERYADDFELSDAQYVHALSVEHLVPGLSDLKAQICSTDMTEACFWKIYFVLLHSKLNKQDAEVLSTPQILEAREQLLQSLGSEKKRGSKFPDESSAESSNASSAPAEEKVIQPPVIQDKAGAWEKSSSEEPSETVSEKFPVSTTEVEMVDKSVVEEELTVANESKTSPVKSKLPYEADEEEEVDEWPDDDPTDEAGHRTLLGREEEDVSFSDLEDDEDDDRR